MRATLKKLMNFLRKEDGPAAVEYAVMLALVLVVCLAAIRAFGSSTFSTLHEAHNRIVTTSS